MFLTTTLGLFMKSMGCFESPHLFPTLIRILYTLPNHHVPLLATLLIQVGFPTSEFLAIHHLEPTWLLSSYTKYTPQSLPKHNKHVLRRFYRNFKIVPYPKPCPKLFQTSPKLVLLYHVVGKVL
jgi:hypothetical protein